MTNTSFNPYAVFPNFYQNPTIQKIAQEPRWTVSTQNDAVINQRTIRKKMPIDFRALMRSGTIYGAKDTTDEYLVTLPTLVSALPNTTNHAYYLDVIRDQIMVLDIEKTCPDHIVEAMLAMPNILYAEESMSGQGIHLIMPIPSNYREFPLATQKRVLQHPHGYYEILMEHWITFTRRPVDPQKFRPSPISTRTWELTWEELASEVTDLPPNTIFDPADEKPEIPHEDDIISLMLRDPYSKTLDDFHQDHSRYEFGLMGYLEHRLSMILKTSAIRDLKEWTDDDRIWLIYRATTESLDHRDKHDEQRNGMPLLLNSAVNIVNRRSTSI